MNPVQNIWEPKIHIIIPDAEYPQAGVRQKLISDLIPYNGAGLCVLVAIQFDDQSSSVTNKVYDISIDWLLPAK